MDRFKWHFKKSDLTADIERLQRYRKMILDDFENAISIRTVQGVKSLLESHSTISDSMARVARKNLELKLSSEAIDSKLECFRQDILSLDNNDTRLAVALDRFGMKHHHTHEVVQRINEQQDHLKSIGQTNLRHVNEIIRASEGERSCSWLVLKLIVPDGSCLSTGNIGMAV